MRHWKREEKKGEKKNEGIYLLLREFTNYFTLNYDSFLYMLLLKYKKDLQRQYQRIRYNIRVGKDILPNSTAGMKDFSNTN